jgi:hypothetical protein
MVELNQSREVADWIRNHIDRYVATDGADGYLWDATTGLDSLSALHSLLGCTQPVVSIG